MVETWNRGRWHAESPWRPTMSEDHAWFRSRKRWLAEIRKHPQGWWEIRIRNRRGKEVAFVTRDATETGAKKIATLMLRKAIP